MTVPSIAPTAAPGGPPTAPPITPPMIAPASGSPPCAEAWVEYVPIATPAAASEIHKVFFIRISSPACDCPRNLARKKTPRKSEASLLQVTNQCQWRGEPQRSGVWEGGGGGGPGVGTTVPGAEDGAGGAQPQPA